MKGRRLYLPLLVVVAFCALPSAAVSAAAAPAWTISSLAVPTNFAPGDASGEDFYEVTAINSGGAATNGSPVTIVDALPSGLTVESVELDLAYKGSAVDFGPSICVVSSSPDGETVTCTVPSAIPPPFPSSADEPALLYPNEGFRMLVHVSTAAVGDDTPLVNHVEVQGGGAPPAAVTVTNEVSSQPALPEFAEFRAELSGEDGLPTGQAGRHPFQYRIGFALNIRRVGPGAFAPAGGSTKDIRVALPAGLIANPRVPSRCTAQRFSAPGGTECPDASAVGLILLRQVDGNGAISPLPLYNLDAPPGMPAQFGFQVANLPFYVNTELRSGRDHGFIAVLANLTELKRITAATLILWGDPAAPSHAPIRGHCLSEGPPLRFSLGSCPVAPATRPFLRLPSSCASPLDAVAGFDLWSRPGLFLTQASAAPPATGCSALEFAPTFAARPLGSVADSPAGLRLDLSLPQGQGPGEPATPDLRDLALDLPAGLSVNPSTAGGLESCSPGQVGVASPRGALPVEFTPAPARCPDAARIGSVEVRTPLLDRPLEGAAYVASPDDNPFGSLLALYLVIDDAEAGVRLKLAGRVEADPGTGRLSARFADNPQIPVEALAVTLYPGPRAPLRMPLTCGAYSIGGRLLPWSAPESGPPVGAADSFAVATAPGGGPCAPSEAALPNVPAFDAGTVTPIAAARSPFVVSLAREDGSQNLARFEFSLPPGLSAKLAGVAECSDAAIDAARKRSGASVRANPPCPAPSQVGVVSASAGSGSQPFYLDGGRVYLAGPYRGAPFSLAAIMPALAGPFDLGTVVLRTALYVDPAKARLRAVGDPLPSILRGIPLDLRSLRMSLDRPGFILNPTSCDPMAIGGTVLTQQGGAAPVSSRFQVGECGRLGFRPKVSLRLLGPTHRGGHPQLRTVIAPRSGDANIGSVAIALPGTELLDNRRIGAVCSQAQFAAAACPPGAVYGRAKVWTPLLDRPLSGPVYLRSSSRRLPDLVASLDGRIPLDLNARIDSVHGRLRTTFEALPDVPLSKVVLTMRGGRRGLFVNTGGLCAAAPRARTSLTAQNGKTREIRPVVKTDCGKRRR